MHLAKSLKGCCPPALRFAITQHSSFVKSNSLCSEVESGWYKNRNTHTKRTWPWSLGLGWIYHMVVHLTQNIFPKVLAMPKMSVIKNISPLLTLIQDNTMVKCFDSRSKWAGFESQFYSCKVCVVNTLLHGSVFTCSPVKSDNKRTYFIGYLWD